MKSVAIISKPSKTELAGILPELLGLVSQAVVIKSTSTRKPRSTPTGKNCSA